MKILVLATRFPPDYGGGARHAFNLCQHWLAKGMDVSVLTASHSNPGTVDNYHGIRVIRQKPARRPGFPVLKRYFDILGYLIRHRHEFDVGFAQAVHNHAFAGFFAGKLLRKPFVAKIALQGHDDPGSIAARRTGWLQRRLLSLATMLIATTHEIQESSLSAGWPAAKLAKIPNGVDILKFRPTKRSEQKDIRRQLAIGEIALTVLFVGKITPRKGVRELIQAWGRIEQHYPKAQLLLVGPYSRNEHWAVDQEFKESLDEQLKTVDTHRVHFLGQVDDPASYFRVADLFVFPTNAEGMPNVVLEAMATGLPIVASNLDPLQEMLPEIQRPHLADPGDVDALAEQLRLLLADQMLSDELGRANRTRAEEAYAIEAIAERYLVLFRSLAGQMT